MLPCPQHKSHISNVLCQAVTSAHWLIPTPASRYWKMISRTNVILIVFILGPRYWQQLTNLHRIYWKSVRESILEAAWSWLTENWVYNVWIHNQRCPMLRFGIHPLLTVTLSSLHRLKVSAPKVCVRLCTGVMYSTVAGMGNSVSPSGTRHQSPLGHGANQQHSVGREAPALTHHTTL